MSYSRKKLKLDSEPIAEDASDEEKSQSLNETLENEKSDLNSEEAQKKNSGGLEGEERREKALWRIPEWFPHLEKEKLEQLYIFFVEVLNFNSRLSLISSRTEEEIDRVHFADSILGGKMILEYTSKKEIHCFGSGNGFPGIVMASLDSERTFFLVDADARKINFLKYIIDRMELKNCTPIHQRVEDIPYNSVSCIISRALGNISQCLLKSYKVCKEGAEYFHFKGSSWMKEVSDIPIQICSFWSPKLIGEYQLPETQHNFAIVLTEREENDEG